MRPYLEIVKKILDKGELKHNRTGVDTLAIAGAMFEHDMSEGAPVLTTKKLAHKSMRVELEGFVRGITDKRWYQERGCNIWDEWCNKQKVLNDLNRTRLSFGSGEVVDVDVGRNLGIVLMQMWDRYRESNTDENGNLVLSKKIVSAIEDMKSSGSLINPDTVFSVDRPQLHLTFQAIREDEYLAKPIDSELVKKVLNLGQLLERDLGPIYGFQWRHFGAEYAEIENSHNYEGRGADQLKTIVETLKKNPDDRRMIVSAWNPLALPQMALPPCHWGFQVTVINNKLNLLWNQRSVDTMIGLPFNIASYGLLLHLLAKETGLQEGKLIGFLGDVHIYENHIEGAKLQLEREPRKLPRYETSPFSSLFDWKYSDTKVLDYNPRDKIDFKIAV